MNQSELSHCEQEQSTIGDQIRAGYGQFGLRLGAQDWLREEAILRKEAGNGRVEGTNAQ